MEEEPAPPQQESSTPQLSSSAKVLEIPTPLSFTLDALLSDPASALQRADEADFLSGRRVVRGTKNAVSTPPREAEPLAKSGLLSYSYVDKDNINAIFVCLICQHPLVEPIAGPCGHHYCKMCLTIWLEKKPECPKCRVALAVNQTRSPDGTLIHLLSELQVFCPNKEYGCPWKGPRGGVTDHLSATCQRVRCPYFHRGCVLWLGTTEQCSEHLTLCPHANTSCPENCGRIYERKDIQQHLIHCEVRAKRQEDESKRRREEEEKARQLETERQALLKERSKIFLQVNPAPVQVVHLNVSGTYLSTTLALLTKYPLSLLGMLFFDQNQLRRLDDGRVFIDRPSAPFVILLSWLQTGRLPLGASAGNYDELLTEALFWELPQLITALCGASPTATDNFLDYYSSSRTRGLLFSKRIIPKALFKGISIPWARFEFSVLTGCDLSGANCTGVSFQQCRVDGIKFAKAKLHSVSFGKNKFERCVFDEADLADARMDGAHFVSCTFVKCDFSTVSPQAVSPEESRSVGIYSRNEQKKDVSAASTKFEDCSFCEANLSAVNFTRIIIVRCDFTRGDLSRANLSNCKLDECKFMQCNLTGANLAGSSVSGTDFSHANFTGATGPSEKQWALCTKTGAILTDSRHGRY